MPTLHRFPFRQQHLVLRMVLAVAGSNLWAQALPPSDAPAAKPAEARSSAQWPVPTQTARPWTWWMWMGSAMDEANVKRQLREMSDAGMGGVTIYAIYGAKGYESRFLDFLSPRWMEMFAASMHYAGQYGLGVDLNPVGGFPAGGPWVTREDASSAGELRRYTIQGGGQLDTDLPAQAVRYLLGVGPGGQKIDLTRLVRGGHLNWTAPPGIWKLYGIVQRQPVQEVKRPAPGGAGYITDPLSVTAMDHYLARFDEAFQTYHGPPLRAQFQDSWEQITALTDGGSIAANWTNDFFGEFRRRRGYDLRSQLLAFFGEGDPDTVARVRYDYRETVNQLHQAVITRWTEWSHARGSLTRYQAHCSPTNIEDTYADADIPESEGAFLGGPDIQIPFIKLASSAAHLAGRPLTSSETFTWLAEHFQVSLAQLKPIADRFFLSGINHIVLSSGVPNTPADVAWPGWMVYWSPDFGPDGGLWHDLPAFDGYITRCQSILQSGRPANDLLLYFPMADFWQIPGEKAVRRSAWSQRAGTEGGLLPYTGVEEEAPALEFQHIGNWNGKDWGGGFIEGGAFHHTAMELWNRGYSYDSVTDKFLAQAKFVHGAVELGGNPYRAIVIPPGRLMPVETLRKLVDLARQGATIVVQDSLPADVPGLNQLEERQREYRSLVAGLHFQSLPGASNRRAQVGLGEVLVGSNLAELLRQTDVRPEDMVKIGLQCIRRREAGGYDYFVVNKGARTVDQWVPLAEPAESAAILNPLFADRTGIAPVRRSASGAIEVYLQLRPGESLVVRTADHRQISGPNWSYEKEAESRPRVIAGPWSVRFIDGGPVLPKSFETDSLSSWTNQKDLEAKRFAGTARYRAEFEVSAAAASDWRLDLGQVCDSARVRINGREIATLWFPPFALPVGKYLRDGSNTIEVDVTNLGANRVADLDRRHVPWNSFYNVGVVNIRYQPFNAANWPLRDSGLLGPVSLTPMRPLTLPAE